MKSYSLFIFSLFFFCNYAWAQLPAETIWTIDKCVSYAVENNLQVQQSKLQTELSKNNQQTAKLDYAPNLNFNSSYGFNFGLNIDPVTNQISQANRQTANFNLSSNWVLYDGGRKYNTIAQRNFQYVSALYSLEAVKNDIKLSVASGFLQILLNREILTVAIEQERITQLQMDRMQVLVDAGARPKGDALQLKAQLARDKQNRIAAENAVTISRLSLANILQLEKPDEFRISSPELEVPNATTIARNPDGIYSTAKENQPAIKAAETTVKSSEEQAQAAYSGYLPTLSLVGQIGTSYSNLIQQPTGTVEAPVQVGVVQGSGQPVFTEQPRIIPLGFEDKPFVNQATDNLNEFVGIQLQVPIFNRFSVRNNYQNARINKQISELQLAQEELNLRQTIYQAHADAKASYNSYLASEIAVESTEEAFKYAQERFNVGALNQFDFENAKNSLAQSQSEMLRAKYDYIFKVKVLEFYLTNQVNL